jgi:hypothetical protein
MKRLILCLTAFFASVAAAFAAAPSPDADPFHNWFTYYYLDKAPEKVPDFLKWIQESGVLERHPDGVAPMEGFLSIVFADNPAQVDGWKNAAQLTGNAKKVVDYAAHPDVKPQEKEIKTASDLDMAWGSYDASGDTAYLSKIVDVLDKKKKLSGDEKQDEATRATAAYSLGVSMTEHESVDRFLQQESGKREGEVAESLKSIVANVQKQREARAFPHRDGDFSAMMIVTDPKIATKAFSGPGGDVVHIKEMNKARAGDKRTIIVVFAGMVLSPEYMANVTYDVQLIDPKGKVYTDQKDLEVLKQKVPTRFRLFSNLSGKSAILLSFDRKDTPGSYQIKVVLKDNVGNKSMVTSPSRLRQKSRLRNEQGHRGATRQNFLQCRRSRACHRAAARHGRSADARLDGPRSVYQDHANRPSDLLVAITQGALAQG